MAGNPQDGDETSAKRLAFAMLICVLVVVGAVLAYGFLPDWIRSVP